MAAGHSAAINYLFSGNIGFEAINLGSEKGYSVLEILKNFEKAVGKTIPYVIDGRRAGDIAVSYADASKAKKIIKLGSKIHYRGYVQRFLELAEKKSKWV